MAVSTVLLVLVLGSNHDQQHHIDEAKENLSRQFGGIKFTSQRWTEPIGMQSDKFLNCLAYAETSHSLNRIRKSLRYIEIRCKDTKALRRLNVVNLDIDILRYGDTILQEEDWQRNYITELLKEIEQ